MDNKFTISQATHAAIAQAMTLANERLQESPSEKFERTLAEVIKQEIAKGLSSAENFKVLLQGTNSYTHTGKFPLAIYEALSAETIAYFELSEIYLSKNTELNTASIRIVFHF